MFNNKDRVPRQKTKVPWLVGALSKVLYVSYTNKKKSILLSNVRKIEKNFNFSENPKILKVFKSVKKPYYKGKVRTFFRSAHNFQKISTFRISPLRKYWSEFFHQGHFRKPSTSSNHIRWKNSQCLSILTEFIKSQNTNVSKKVSEIGRIPKTRCNSAGSFFKEFSNIGRTSVRLVIFSFVITHCSLQFYEVLSSGFQGCVTVVSMSEKCGNRTCKVHFFTLTFLDFGHCQLILAYF